MSFQIDYRQAIRENYSRLGKKKQKIADLLLQSPMLVLEKTLGELAELCQCEQTTIIRFAQQLNYAGFAELKLAVARQSNAVWQDFSEETGSGAEESADRFRLLCNKLASLHSEAIRKTLNGVDESRIDLLVKDLGRAKKVMVAGAGTSRLAASDLHIKLARLGVNGLFFDDYELWKTFVGYLDKDDMLIVFSHSGKTDQIVKIAQLAHARSVTVCAITSSAESPLGKLAGHLLLTDSDEHLFRLGGMASRSAQLAVGDLIALKFSMSDKQRSWNYLEKSYDAIL